MNSLEIRRLTSELYRQIREACDRLDPADAISVYESIANDVAEDARVLREDYDIQP